MQISLEELEQSKIFVHAKLEGMPFQHPLSYFSKFIEQTRGLGEHIFQAEVGAKNTNDDSTDNVSYSRVSVICKIPREVQVDDPLFNKYVPKIGMLYALDTQKPVIKVFTGSEVSACLNTCVFGASSVIEAQVINSRKPIDDAIDRYIQENEKTLEMIQTKVEKLVDMNFTGVDYDRMVGKMVQFGYGLPQLGIQPIMGGIKDMCDSKSIYYAGAKPSISGWKMYNSVTEALKKSSIIDMPTRVQLLEDLFFPKSLN